MLKAGPFMVVFFKEEKTQSQKLYYKLKIRKPNSDGGEMIDAKMWSEAISAAKLRSLPSLKEGMLLEEISYEEDSFQGKRQLILKSYKVSDQESNPLDYSNPTEIDIDGTVNYLFDWEGWEAEYKQFFGKLREYIVSRGQWDDLIAVPAGSSNHHSRRGGLLQHTKEMVEIAECLCRVENSVAKGVVNFDEVAIDFQVLRASIILHDMGKINDYCPKTLTYKSTVEGKLIEHSQWGMLAVELLWSGSNKSKLNIQHCVLAHHGKGIAAVGPQTVEAYLLHKIDAISAYMDVFKVASRLKKKGEEIPYNRMLEAVPQILD
jgi:hypothetical protein